MEAAVQYFGGLGVSAMVVNAQHMRAVPGRKTDVKDAEWIADLLQHGLLKASFIPDKSRRELQELVGYCKSLLKEQTAEVNRLQKVLEGAKDGTHFQDLGAEYYNQFNKERKINAYLKKLKALGWQAPVAAAAQSA